MKPNIRFYETIDKPRSATVTISEIKIYLHNIEWENPRELWFTMTSPGLDIDSQSQAIFTKNKTLSCYLFKGNIEEIETSYKNKISKKTYRSVIRKVFTSDIFANKYMNILLNKIYDIDHETTDIENRIVNLTEKIAKLKDTQSTLWIHKLNL